LAEQDYRKFKALDFSGFRRLAADESLSRYEKIGFPDSYREGKEEAIFADICAKATNLNQRERVVLDIGPGCSGPAQMLVDLCRRNGHHVHLVDSPEMLRLIPDAPFIEKIAAQFPVDCPDWIQKMNSRLDAIITYSVLQYVYPQGSIFGFLDSCLRMMAPGGQLLIGDIPNLSKRKRFFSSDRGIRFHQEFMKAPEPPAVRFNVVEPDEIDDAVVLAILARARAAGFDAYLLPQPEALPMANRREDILITRP
jgi:cyclopropane fatty-acyl-phospholipid synthase-like methyltransferase